MTNNDDDTRDDYDYVTAHEDSIQKIEKFQIIIAIISTICSSSVCFILLYKRHILLKDRPFIHIILMIALTDTFTSLTYSMGYPASENLCFVQGFFGVLFGRASWMYTVALVILLINFIFLIIIDLYYR